MKSVCRDSNEHREKSPSPRRAWIEIELMRKTEVKDEVALPTEGVD